jgi:hypothetical protein
MQINTYHVFINNTFSGIVSAVSYRQARIRAKRKFRGPVDVIGLVSSKAKV